jgi:hypothetical protein
MRNMTGMLKDFNELDKHRGYPLMRCNPLSNQRRPCASYSEIKERYHMTFPLDYNRTTSEWTPSLPSSYHHHPSSHTPFPISILITTLASFSLSRRLNEIKAKAITLRQRHMHRNSRNHTARIPTIPHPPDLFRPPTQAQHRNRRNLTRGLKAIAAHHLELSTVKSETDHGRRGLHDTDSIIDIQLPRGFWVQPDRDDDVETLLAHFRRCHPRGGTLRVDDAAAEVQRDVSDGEVREGHVRAVAAEGRKGPEVVGDVVGHIHIDAGSVLFRDRGDEDAGP